MASRLDRTPDYISKHNPQPPVIVGNVPWADYFNALYPGAVRPWNAWHGPRDRHATQLCCICAFICLKRVALQ